MAWYDFFKRLFKPSDGARIQQQQQEAQDRAKTRAPSPISPAPAPNAPPQTSGQTPSPRIKPAAPFSTDSFAVRRHFYNEPKFQTYGSFFAHWGGWITAGHVITEARELRPPFTHGDMHSWPNGLDACTIGCTLPADAPAPPRAGQDIIIQGYPAGSRNLEERRGSVYFERAPGTWIAHIKTPDEPVVTGMSGGAVLDAKTREPIGILITRNSPADLNSDREPDESADFVALNEVWHALSGPELMV